MEFHTRKRRCFQGERHDDPLANLEPNPPSSCGCYRAWFTMSLRHAIRRGGGVIASSSARQVARGGGGPPMPPFARNKPVDYQVKAYCLCRTSTCSKTIVVFFSPVPSRAMFAGAMQTAWVTHAVRFFPQTASLSRPDILHRCGCVVFPVLT